MLLERPTVMDCLSCLYNAKLLIAPHRTTCYVRTQMSFFILHQTLMLFFTYVRTRHDSVGLTLERCNGMRRKAWGSGGPTNQATEASGI